MRKATKTAKVKRMSRRGLTSIRKKELTVLAALPDDQIDTSDIPELTEKFWETAIRNPFYRPLKRQLTLRLDADIIAWLRLQGRGYQTRANALLRDAMLGDLSPKKRDARRRPQRTNQRQDGMTQARRAS